MPSNFFLLLLSLACDFAHRISSGVLPTERTPSWDVLGGTELRAFVPNFIRLAEPTDGQCLALSPGRSPPTQTTSATSEGTFKLR
jgi:hypothetical protein